MKRRTTVVLGILVIVFLGGVMATSMGSTTTRVSPQEINEGDYVGEEVSLHGRISAIQMTSDKIVFAVTGNQSEGEVTVIYEGSIGAATFETGRPVIVTGVVEDSTTVEATSKPKIQAHQPKESEDS